MHGGIHFHPHRRRPRSAPPRQLLPVPANFTNRHRDLESLNDLRATGLQLIVVSGPAGIGKTTLVSKWLRSLSTEFPDGQLYADLRGHSAGEPVRPAEIHGQFLRALGAGPPPTDAVELASLWRSLTADRRIAIMLDNSFTAAQIRPLLLSGPDGLVVVTSRRRLTGLRMQGRAFTSSTRSARPPVSNCSLVGSVRTGSRGALGGPPPGGALRGTPASGLPGVCTARDTAEAVGRCACRRPRTERGQRPAGRARSGGETSVRKALDASYAVLSSGTARLYRTLGLLPVRTFDTMIAAASCGESLDWAERRLDELVEANLVEDVGPESCRFHDLLRIHAHERAMEDDTSAAREEALRRFCDWCLYTATAAQERLTPVQFTLPRSYAHRPDLPLPFADDVAALGWLDSHRAQLQDAVRLAASNGWYDTSWMLVDALWPSSCDCAIMPSGSRLTRSAWRLPDGQETGRPSVRCSTPGPSAWVPPAAPRRPPPGIGTPAGSARSR
ncbi:hypothetical protein NKH18_24705 [Streptomyces sp. M10(2022)]